MKISCIAIDDEPLALEMIKRKILHVDFLELKATFNSASKALKFLSESSVDCIFLDVHMPDFNGVELAKLIDQFAEKPIIIYVTAYACFLEKELEGTATLYLLKPYSLEDFIVLTNKIAQSKKEKNMEELEDNSPCLCVNINSRKVKIYFNEILFLQSMGDYVKIFTNRQSSPLITLITLKKIKSYLPKNTFVQINRSEIIHLNKVSSFRKTSVSIGVESFRITPTYKEAYGKIKNYIS